MKKSILKLCFLFLATTAFSQAGHIMQGAGAVNMSMGGAATGLSLDITGATHWNPAAISTFDENILKFDIGLFFSSPELSSSLPEGALWPAGAFGPGTPASPVITGSTEDDRGISPLPALAMVWGSGDSKHTFGASAIGISGFGVTFPEEANTPALGDGTPNAGFDPTANSNAINYPQAAMGFGRVESNYILLQVAGTWAYELSDNFSFGVQPSFNYATLELMPNPTANPSQTAGYPSTDVATANGFGAQVGLYYDSESGLSAGASYKTNIGFSEFEFENTYLDNTTGTNNFQMDFPAIFSVGVGYSTESLDFALDYRSVNYENTEGFEQSGWTSTASVAGFGWRNIDIISAGVQYKGVDNVPIRVGYTYSSNPISDELAFFSVPATAIIKNAFQLGFSYVASDKMTLDFVYHYGTSGDPKEGRILNPQLITGSNPLGKFPGSSVSYEMETSMLMVGIGYKL